VIQLVVLLLALLFAAPAWAQGEPSIESEIQAGVKQADALLASLEYQRAREILERLASDRRTREVRKSMRARLYVALGRARAELGDDSGMSEAFYDAVALDPTVTLPRGTSPKIVGALERARENAPATAPRGPKTKPEPRSDSKPDPKPDPPLKPTRTSTKTAVKPARSSTTTATVRPPDGGPALVFRVIGKVQEHARIRVVVDAFGVPRSAKIEARIRTEGSRVYQPYLMPWVVGTATQAALALTLDEPRYEIYVEAKSGKKVVARAGSVAEPIVLEPAAVPSLAEAYSGDVATATTTRTSTAVAIATVPVSNDEPWTTTEALILAGGVLAAALIVVLVVVASTSGTNNCDANEGFGCTDVSVRPLLRF